MNTKYTLALMAVLGIAFTSVSHAAVTNVVLVHGAFADGSGWKPVADILKGHGYKVFVVQEPETTFSADVAATKLVLDRAGPCVLVGHSYGGMIISEAGGHEAVRSLVYVAAFQPEAGESAGGLHGHLAGADRSGHLRRQSDECSVETEAELCSGLDAGSHDQS